MVSSGSVARRSTKRGGFHAAHTRPHGLHRRPGDHFRNDLAFAPPLDTVTNPHTFLTNLAGGAPGTPATYAVGAEQQIATFLASGGTTIIDPDLAGPYFEVPIAGPLPETLNFLP